MTKYLPNASSTSEVSSDIQPWGLEFLRFDQLLKAADDLAVQVRMYSTELIQQYWVILYQLYMMMLPYMSDGSIRFYRDINPRTIKKFEDWEEDYKNGYREFPKELVEDLTYYHETILRTKHYLGLGIPMSQNFDIKHKLKNALLGKT